MSTPPNIQVFSPRGQVIGILLYVLADLKVPQKKRFVTGCIRMRDLFAYTDEDSKPYPSVLEKGSIDPRWTTLVAFARQDCMDRDWMNEKGREQWQISALGKAVFSKLSSRCADGTHVVRKGYLWTPKLKKILCPTYEPSEADAKRPFGSIYDDTKLSAWMDELGI